MTAYTSWKKHQIRNNWKSLFSIFLTVILLFAIFNGLSRGYLLKNNLKNKIGWDAKSPFVVAVNSINPSVMIFEPDSKKMFVFSLGSDAVIDTGMLDKPLAKVSDLLGAKKDFAKSMSLAFGAKIDNYLDLKNSATMNEQQAITIFKNFASITTPFSIITGGYKGDVEDTNITRVDAIRLWWQVKGLSTNDVVFKDLSSISVEILTNDQKKILGADTASLNKEIEKYLENVNLLSENLDVVLINATGNPNVSRLASSFIASGGIQVSSWDESESLVDSTFVTAKQKSYVTSYLAKIFDCDINEAPDWQNSSEIKITLGRDFANRWFK